jgi:hypothetical protein
MIRLTAIATATLTISTGAAMAATNGYVNPDPLPRWMPVANSTSSSNTPTRRGLPMRAIVNGHNVQPRGDNLKALGYSDLTSQEAEEVDRLYRQLMHSQLVADRIPA